MNHISEHPAVYSQSIVWIFTSVAEQVSRVMAPEEEPEKK